MKSIFDNVSFDCSMKVTKAYSTSFSSAVKMLAPSIRQDIYNIYGFVRFADEIVDTFHDYDKEMLFAQFENDLALALTQKISLNPILNSFQHTIHKYNIQPDDYVIKLTGRYNPENSNFFDLVTSPENREKYDVFMKFFNVCTKEFMENDCVLGLFACKSKYINSFKYKRQQSAEVEFATYIRENVPPEKIMEVERLYLECCFGNDHSILHV